MDDPAGTERPAVFLDRDGTLIEEVHYLTDPSGVRLLPGVAVALRRLEGAGFARVLVTNQSAIGRGLLTEDGLRCIHDAMTAHLARAGASLDAMYYCPDAPDRDDRPRPANPDRKPGPGMLLRAAADHGLDLGRSWMVGDMMRDLLAGRNAGCLGSILVRSGKGSDVAADAHAAGFAVCDNLDAAVDLILSRPAPGRFSLESQR